ncbi:AAA family ATPase [Methylosinus sp. PW1]|uniref:AAA family ATPase n=1 Tax=Methylosinus sp. PW1 TaxID=107636 RepID=UPI00056429CA|nr:AAA family ATPase [Methylosinus sp. PW1]
MFEGIVDFAQHNQFLTGGVGAMALGWLAYQAKSLPDRIMNAIDKNLLVHVTVSDNRFHFSDVDRLLSAHRVRRFSKNFDLSCGSLVVGYGSGWAHWNGTWIRYTKSKDTSRLHDMSTIAMTFMTTDERTAQAFIDEAIPKDVSERLVVNIEAGNGWTQVMKRRRRLDSVFANDDVGRRIVERLRWFEDNHEWYERRGIPRKIGFVLHGPPGTGKTSLIQAVASELGFEIRYLRSLLSISERMSDITPKTLLVVEDIDTLAEGLNRTPDHAQRRRDSDASEKEAAAAGWAMHEILNTLDGMQTPDALKFVITTNHLDRLDPAILRPGRVDHIYEIGPLEIDEARRMFRAFYDRDGIRGYVPTTGAALQAMFSTMIAEEAEDALDAAAMDGLREAA